jgi:hypothetical protein
MLTIPAIKKMQIKITLRFYLIPVRISIIQNITNKCWGGCRKNELSCTVGRNKLVQPLWKTIWRLLNKLILDLPYNPTIPFLGICLEECDSNYYKGTCTSIVIGCLFGK